MATIRSSTWRKKRPAPPPPGLPFPPPPPPPQSSSITSTARRKKRPAPPPPSFTLLDGILTPLAPQSPLPASGKVYTSLPRRWYKRPQQLPSAETSSSSSCHPPPSTLRRMMSLLSSRRKTPEETMEISDLAFIDQLEKEEEKALVHASIVHQPQWCKPVAPLLLPRARLVKVVTVDPALGKTKFFTDKLINVDSCSCFKRRGEKCKNTLKLQLFVETSTSHNGPIHLSTCWLAKMSEIQARVTRVLLISPEKQRWIIGKSLVTNFQWSLASYGIKENYCRIFLYVVQPVACKKELVHHEEEEEEVVPVEEVTENVMEIEHQFEVEHSAVTVEAEEKAFADVRATVVQDRRLTDLLLLADAEPLTRNAEDFVCPVCFELVEQSQGVVLKDCLHCFCKDCLVGTIENAEDAEIKCPFSDQAYSCQAVMQDREIKALVPRDVYERLLRKSLNTVEARLESYHCAVKDCPGWVEKAATNAAPTSFLCPVCAKVTCLKCSAVHENGETCGDLGEKKKKKEKDASEEYLKEMLKRDEKNTIECPTCHVVILRKWGCDWLRCALCKTEICWVTRGPRWGPNGKGDTSGGCRCRVNGVPCHPSCRYCH